MDGTMNKQKILKIAEDAGFSWLTTKDYSDELVKFATILIDAEREECAKACEEQRNTASNADYHYGTFVTGADFCARAIRDRSKDQA